MKSLARFLSGFILGAAVGAAVAILLAPESGENLRGQIKGEAERIQIEVKKAATERRAELEKQLTALREPK